LYGFREERPVVTYLLVAANIVVFGLTYLVGRIWMILLWGLTPINILEANNPLAFLYGLATIFTSMFIHDGILHIFFNMWALLILGREVEVALGRARFTLLYFLSGFVGGLAYVSTALFIPRNLLIPAVGASGAVFGVMGAFAVLFPRRPLAMFFYLIPIIAPAFVAIAILAIIQTILALILPFSSIAYSAHVGGLAVGLAAALIWKRLVMRKHYGYYWALNDF
jgi:membrane associated rhomboid family serine protease